MNDNLESIYEEALRKLRIYLGICLEVLRKITKNFSQNIRVSFESKSQFSPLEPSPLTPHIKELLIRKVKIKFLALTGRGGP
jgi:hypothetical protein